MTLLLIASISALTIPIAVFCTEVLASVLIPPWRRSTSLLQSGSVAVIIPAHNESKGLTPTVSDVVQQLKAGDRLIVVADNCTDDTADIASRLGAEVIERNDRAHVGKGYALQHAVHYLSQTRAPDIAIIIDADCRLDEHALSRLVSAVLTTGRPAQALYLMNAHPLGQSGQGLAVFAWRIKNWARPVGLAALGLPCQLMGSGMAFPWSVIGTVNLGSAHITEDLQLGLAVASHGNAPVFCPSAVITSTFPSSDASASVQHQRWEQGHLQLLTEVGKTFLRALQRGNLPLFALALDLTVPPIALLIFAVMGVTLVALAAWIIGLSTVTPVLFGGTLLAAMATALTVAWFRFARDVSLLISPRKLGCYLLRKLTMYAGLIRGRRMTSWIRTNRDE